MPIIRLRDCIIAVAAVACGCATNRVDNDLRGAVVRLDRDSVALERTPDVTRFTVNVVVRNDRATPLYFVGCGMQAQEQINGRWETVWAEICVSPGGGSLAPGDSSTFAFSAGRWVHRNMEPQLDPRAAAGRYRLVVDASYDGPLDYGTVYSDGRRPRPVKFSALTSPVFIVYSR